MQTEEIAKQLQGALSPQRFSHSMGVADCARALAVHYGADPDKAYLAGLVHDCAKEFSPARMKELCGAYGLSLDEVTRNEHKLVHAWLGAEYAKRALGVTDEEIYDAVRYHTTAKADMCLLTKIIYVADYIEPNRVFDGVEGIRETAFKCLDAAVLEGLDYTIESLLGKKRMLHPETVSARNYIILKSRQE